MFEITILNMKPNDGFRKEVMTLAVEIEALMGIDPECLSNEEYTERWNEINEKFHWLLIRMEQYLGGLRSTPQIKEFYDVVIDIQRIGKRTGYYWNKYSKELFKMMREEGMTEVDCNLDCKNCEHSERRDLRWLNETTYRPDGWIKCTKYGIWEETVELLKGDE